MAVARHSRNWQLIREEARRLLFEGLGRRLKEGIAKVLVTQCTAETTGAVVEQGAGQTGFAERWVR